MPTKKQTRLLQVAKLVVELNGRFFFPELDEKLDRKVADIVPLLYILFINNDGAKKSDVLNEMSGSNVTTNGQVLDSLPRLTGWVTFKRSKADRRQVLVVPTQKFQAAVEKRLEEIRIKLLEGLEEET